MGQIYVINQKNREKYINEFQNSIKTTKGSEDKALIQPKGCGRELKWDEIEDVNDYVLNELKKVDDNNLGVILDIANDVKSLIEYEKYEEALDMIFIEKTNDNKKIEEKKNFLNEILKKSQNQIKKLKNYLNNIK